MAHNVETMAYVGETPWHGLGVEVPSGITPNDLLIKAGLAIEWLHEHYALQWKMLDQMTMGEDRLWRLPEDSVKIPLALSLRARKVG